MVSILTYCKSSDKLYIFKCFYCRKTIFQVTKAKVSCLWEEKVLMDNVLRHRGAGPLYLFLNISNLGTIELVRTDKVRSLALSSLRGFT